jgi:hypothetical protein
MATCNIGSVKGSLWHKSQVGLMTKTFCFPINRSTTKITLVNDNQHAVGTLHVTDGLSFVIPHGLSIVCLCNEGLDVIWNNNNLGQKLWFSVTVFGSESVLEKPIRNTRLQTVTITADNTVNVATMVENIPRSSMQKVSTAVSYYKVIDGVGHVKNVPACYKTWCCVAE